MSMSKTASINVRVDPVTKARAEKIFADFGISVTDAINIFLHKAIMVGGLPFEVRQLHYNATTESAMQEAREIASGKRTARTFHTVNEMAEAFDTDADT
jgi:DNA-damage-inducible protein J